MAKNGSAQYATRAQRDAFRDPLFVADMRQAGHDLEAGNLARLERIVERHRPSAGEKDSRGWEWYYLQALRQSGPCQLEVPGGANAVDADPMGDRWASAGRDGAVRIWEQAGSDWRQERELQAGAEPVRLVEWSPDGSRLAALGGDLAVRIWDASGEARPLVVPAVTPGGLALVVALA